MCVRTSVYVGGYVRIYRLLCMTEKGLTSHILMMSDGSSLR